jgi:hypothetical protein
MMPPEIVDLNDYRVEDWVSTPQGEARQAEEALQHYKTLFSHPLVEGITWWDIADGGWLNAPAGLLRRDGSSKPAYEELLNLIRGDWWISPTRLVTDELGKTHFCGFLGDYELEYRGLKRSFPVREKGNSSKEVRLG